MEKVFVLLDIDDTVLDFLWAEKNALARTLEKMGLEPKSEVLSRYSQINAMCWQALERGEMSRPQVLSGRFDMLFEETGIKASGYETQLTYERLLAEGHKFMPGAEELLQALYGKYELYAVSNGTALVQDSRIKSSGIGKYFSKIFISERVGVDKPRKEFFDRVFAQIPDFCPERSIIVGDSLSSDILGGKNAGIMTCRFNYRRNPKSETIVPDYEIYELSQLPPLLEEIFGC